MESYDLVIIGGGAGAFSTAIQADALKAKTVLINDGLPLGGTCVNVGCIPSKRLLFVGDLVWQAQHHGFKGVELAVKRLDFAKVIEDELALVEKLRQEKYESVLQGLKHVHHIEGKAVFVDGHTVKVGNRVIHGEKFVLAVGSTAIIPPIAGIKGVGYLTHVEALQTKKLPKSLLVIGAGPVGLELGQMYAHFGSKVTILQRGPQILSKRETEPEIAQALRGYLEDEGIDIYTGVEVKSARRDGKDKVVTTKVGNKEKEFRAEEILLAVGKRPNTDGLGLEKTGVVTDGRGAIVVDSFLQTSTPHIYAVGDATNKPKRLETIAGKEGKVAATNALEQQMVTINYTEVPYAVFTTPQLAGVGLTDAEAVGEGFRCACHTIPFSLVPKAPTINDERGAIKMVIDRESHKILGVHMVAPLAADLIHEATLALKFGMTVEHIIDTVHVFPTLSEATKIAAQSYVRDISKVSCCVE